MSSLRRNTWYSLVTFGLQKAGSLISTVVLARLLPPSDFGLLGLAFLALGLLTLFNDFGLGGSMVVRQDLSRRALNMAFALMLLSGVALAGVGYVAAPLVALAFEEPRVTPLFQVLALSLPVAAVTWFYMALLARSQHFGRRLAAVGVQVTATLTVSLTLALDGRGVWSLVLGWVAGIVALALALVVAAPERIAPWWTGYGEIRDLMGMAGGFLTQGAITFLSQNADFLVIGRLLGPSQLGLYTVAFRLGQLPSLGLAAPVVAATFPEYARRNAAGEDVRSHYLVNLQRVAALGGFAAVFMSAVAPVLLAVVYGPQWTGAAVPLTVLGLWGAVHVVETMSGSLLNSLGHAASLARLTAAVFPFYVLGIVVGAVLGDIPGVSAALLVHAVLMSGFQVRLLHGRDGPGGREHMRALGGVLVAVLVMWGMVRVAAALLPGEGVAALAALLLGAVAVYLLVLRLTCPELLRSPAAMLARRLRSHD